MDSIAPEMTTLRLVRGAKPILPPLRFVLNVIREKSQDPEFIYKRLIDISDYQDAQSNGSMEGSESMVSLQNLEDIQYIYACLGGARARVDPTEAQVRECFGLPMGEAAAMLGLVSASALRRVCRKYGIAKWPREKRTSPKESRTPQTSQTEPPHKRSKTHTKWVVVKPIG